MGVFATGSPKWQKDNVMGSSFIQSAPVSAVPEALTVVMSPISGLGCNKCDKGEQQAGKEGGGRRT